MLAERRTIQIASMATASQWTSTRSLVSSSGSLIGDRPRGGRVLVTDLQLMTDSPRWKSNARVLAQDGVYVSDNVDMFDLGGTLEGSAMHRLTTEGHLCAPQASLMMGDLRLAVVSGLYPHYLMSAAVDALLHQLPRVDAVLVLYAHGDVAPRCQDSFVLHLQGWSADVDVPTPYVVRDTKGYSRCHSAESRAREDYEDPALVRVSMFMKNRDFHYALLGTRISPRRAVQHFRQRGMDVLFLAEGDGSLARACLEEAPLAPLPLQEFGSGDPGAQPEGCLATHRYHRDAWEATYAEVLEKAMLQRDDMDCNYGNREAISTALRRQAAETWATMRPTKIVRTQNATKDVVTGPASEEGGNEAEEGVATVARAAATDSAPVW